MTIHQLFIAAAALLIAALLVPIGPTMRGVLFVVLIGASVIALIGLGLNHVGSAFN
jgi:hypothetical protein